MTESKPKLSIVVPCYNEAKNIPLVLSGFRDAFAVGDRRQFAELIIVDNNSKDATAETLCRELAKPEYSFARSVFEPKAGYGAAIKCGLRAARGNVLAWTHGDVQADPEDVFRAYDAFQRAGTENLIVKGNRTKRSLSQVFFSFGMAVIASAMLGRTFFEINAQPKLFGRNFLDAVLAGPDDFSLDLYLLYRAKQEHRPIRTIDVTFKKRLHGESKWAFSFRSKLTTIWRTIRYIERLAQQRDL